jgi:hypothetical protein
MLEWVSLLIGIVSKFPAGIDYFYMSPAQQWIPDSALKKTHQSENFLLAIVGLNNVSSKVLRSFRIKFPFPLRYDPVIDVRGSFESVNARYIPDRHEMSIQQLDPGEGLYVLIFLSRSEAENFDEPKVIVADRLLSRGMRAIGVLKRKPKEALLMMVLFAAMMASLVAAGAVGYMAYLNSSLNPKYKAVQQAIRGSVGCFPTAYERSKVTDALLLKNMFGEKFLLHINHVSNREQLLKKKYVVICLAKDDRGG